MRDERVKFVQEYLQREFPGANVEHRRDFERNAEAFKVSFNGDTALLKISGEFLNDNSKEEIGRLFDLWALSSVLAKEKELGVLVTQDGPSTFEW